MGKTRTAAAEYSVHPAVLMTQQWVRALKEKTGRSLEEWMKFIPREGPETEAARRDWLKQEHGLGTNTAWWLAERSVGKGGRMMIRIRTCGRPRSMSKRCTRKNRSCGRCTIG